MRRIVTCSASVLALVLVTGAGVSGAQKNEQVFLDKDFLVHAFTNSHAAVRLSELADKHSNNQKVKDFAQKIVKDHKEMNDKLSKMANDQKVGVVAGTEQSVKDTYERLSKLNGADFDRDYLKAIINNHEATVQMMEAQSKQGKDATLTNFAKTALPGAQQHLKDARALAAEVK